jgi:phospholipase/carboxylesterase
MSQPDFIHRYIPPRNGSTRVLLLLHGTGGNESDLLPLGRELDPDAALLSPRGRVLENGAPRFFRRLAEGVFDEEDVVRRAHELADFVTEASRREAFALEAVTAVGYSNGANIASAMLLLRAEAIRGALLFRAMVPLSESPAADLSGKRVLISAGAHDPIVPLENVQRLRALLEERGAEVELQQQEHAGHGLTRDDLEIGKRWLATQPKS